MQTLVSGAVASVAGIIGISLFHCEFLHLLAGTLPIALILGGGLAIYLGLDELKDARQNDMV